MPKEGHEGSDDGDERTATVADSMADGERRERQFRLGGLTLELTGVSADIEELALGLEPIELGLSAPPESETDDADSNRTESREADGRGAGARLGAFLGRKIGSFLGRTLDRGVRVLWRRIRGRSGSSRDSDPNATEPDSAGESTAEADPHEFDDELRARLDRAVGRDASEN
ncbi:hypothetical protein [Haladaptatus sp. DYF46]|uniref:hypothetical protein n=1 Tax=Haladaptatus sp. DYF46 TaxID=2886041 RepID=UPI001E549B9C|nr:hypothetical protein [Haladaptatus sp. DYF46]